MTINVQLLEETMGRILAEPENWNQGEWATRDPERLPDGNVCGTAMCFAGHAVVLAGATLTFAGYDNTSGCLTPSGRVEAIVSYAARILGLSDGEADSLFNGYNDINNLQCQVKKLIEKAGETS